MRYGTLRTVHLLCALVSLPWLLMYAVSAVQMAHPKWFNTRAAQSTSTLNLPANLTTAEDVARQAHLRGDIRGKFPKFRVLTPAMAHEVSYTPGTGLTTIANSRAQVPLGMLNRLHHSAGLWPNYGPLKLWGAAVGFVSLAVVGLAITGIWMWWSRRQDRVVGAILIGTNLVFAMAVLILIRSAGP
jgi:hypothetical protein